MASEEIIPLEQLLAAISEESPVGRDIRDDDEQDSLYQAIKDARIAARSAERNNMFDNDNSEADAQWRKIIELAPDILLHHTKDLEIACWFTEALVRRYGFQGLRDGFKLIEGLIDSFWDGLYPLPDEDGIETRVASLTGLNGEGAEGVLITPIRNVSLTEGSDPGPFNYWKYQQVVEVEKIIDEETRSERASRLGFNIDDVDRAVAESSETFFIDINDDLSEAIATYRRIGALLDQHCGINDSPPSSNIINILEACLGTIRHIGKHKIPERQNDANENDESATPDALKTDENQLKAATGEVRTRDEAFKQLLEISQFFRKTEPHSPISYMLERVVKWGDLPLDSLIRELIPDSSARDYYGSLTGIRTDDD
ncbi:MAG: type VI secretion system protein TssA [Gammaproteobacteria bacterium]|nr:type VI secretion system protein TssA [Gammaproteobacteria bacterium]